MNGFDDGLNRLLRNIKTFLLMKSEITMLQRLMIAGAMLALLLSARLSRCAEDALARNTEMESRRIHVICVLDEDITFSAREVPGRMTDAFRTRLR